MMNKIKLLEALIEATSEERNELAERLFFSLQNRMAAGDMTVEFVSTVLEDIAADYIIDKDEKAL